ncbi:hypothetical protein CLAFUR4_06257 [Fulvia fulva]|nr:hypothetical protein CLAFUR4_06257 [Fulvia fulva]WPV29417.1 hypothetical protein CLAFUW7_06250 [Fulvia fulva]
MDGQLRNQLSLDDFLDLNGPTGEVCYPSESKESFLAKLGLDESKYTHKRVHVRMRREAKAQYELALATPELRNLLASAKSAEEKQSAMDYVTQQVKQMIYQAASSETKFIYDLVRNDKRECWVIDWVLRREITRREDILLEGEPTTTPQTTTSQSSADATHAEAPHVSHTPPAKVKEEVEKDGVVRGDIPGVLSPMSVQHPLNARDGDS